MPQDFLFGNFSEDLRVGTTRPSTRTNPLLAKAGLGQAKKSLFNATRQDVAFGQVTTLPDPEGAREIMMRWDVHRPSKGKENLDFVAMNKLSSIRGLTTPQQLHAFRETCPVVTRQGNHTQHQRPPGLPSDRDPGHTYGAPSGHRPAEVQRVKGPAEPSMKHLMQGAYHGDWVRENFGKSGPRQRPYIPPVPTRAAIGHAIGAQQKYKRLDEEGEEWKISKFRTVPSKVAYLVHGRTIASSGQQQQSSHSTSSSSSPGSSTSSSSMGAPSK